MDNSEFRNQAFDAFENPFVLCNSLFQIDGEPVELAPFQEEIIDEIINKRHNRILIWCATQAGKSAGIAMGLILLAIFYPNERIVNVSATNKQAGVIFQYVREHLFDHPWITQSLGAFSDEAKDKVLASLSRDEISFKRNTTLKILSSESGNPPGEGLLGHSATIVVIDESGSIKDNIYRTKILRMLGAKRKKKAKMLIEIGTPHNEANHFVQAWDDPDYHKIFVDWRRAVKEDRLDYDFVMKQKRTLSPREFDRWYNLKPQKKSEKKLFPHSWIMRAANKKGDFSGSKTLGVDVAGFGKDRTILTSIVHTGDKYRVDKIKKFEHKTTMNTTGQIINFDKKENFKVINVDAAGIGAGVVDRLKEQKKISDKIQGITSSSSPSTPDKKERFINLKAEIYFNLYKILERDNLQIPKDDRLMRQLGNVESELTSSGKSKIVYPARKSPDELDSLALACFSYAKAKKPEFWSPLTA